jgi:putative nucleotidyltransferase with HDIG domain
MSIDVEHFRTKLGKKIVALFFLSALLPTATLALLSYSRVQAELEIQTGERLNQGTTDAAMAIIERVQAIESEMILLAASTYPLAAAVRAGIETPLQLEDLRRLSDVSLISDVGPAITPMVGSLREIPELSDEAQANVTLGQTALTVVPGAREDQLQILIARAWNPDRPEDGILWGQIVGDSLWSTAQVYATSIANTEVDFQDDRGYCILDPQLRPIDCAGGLVSWMSAGPPEGLVIDDDAVHGSMSWINGGKRYNGHYRRVYLRGFNSDNWTIVVGESEEAMLATLSDFRRTLIGFLVLTLAVVALVAAMRIRQSMEPLAQLREGTRRLAAKDFSARVHISSGDEFEELAGSFNDMARQVGTLVDELEDLSWSTIATLARTIDAKSHWTAGHSERVSQMGVLIARTMGLPKDELDRLHRGGLLHDIGKIGIPATIIDKKGSLTEEEYAMMKSHVTIGARILEPLTALKDVIPIVLYHHERWDGRGYEAQLAGAEIPLLARILCVADTYDAIRSDRPYRAGRSPDETLEEIAMCSGSQFDAEAVEAFVEYMASEEGELASVGRFTTPFGLPGIEGGESSRKLVAAEQAGV